MIRYKTHVTAFLLLYVSLCVGTTIQDVYNLLSEPIDELWTQRGCKAIGLSFKTLLESDNDDESYNKGDEARKIGKAMHIAICLDPIPKKAFFFSHISRYKSIKDVSMEFLEQVEMQFLWFVQDGWERNDTPGLFYPAMIVFGVLSSTTDFSVRDVTKKAVQTGCFHRQNAHRAFVQLHKEMDIYRRSLSSKYLYDGDKYKYLAYFPIAPPRVLPGEPFKDIQTKAFSDIPARPLGPKDKSPMLNLKHPEIGIWAVKPLKEIPGATEPKDSTPPLNLQAEAAPEIGKNVESTSMDRKVAELTQQVEKLQTRLKIKEDFEKKRANVLKRLANEIKSLEIENQNLRKIIKDGPKF